MGIVNTGIIEQVFWSCFGLVVEKNGDGWMSGPCQLTGRLKGQARSSAYTSWRSSGADHRLYT